MKLYVKKDIPLNELKKLGFEHMIFQNKYRYMGKDTSVYIGKDRSVSVSNFLGGDIYDLSIIYDLIMKGFIESR